MRKRLSKLPVRDMAKYCDPALCPNCRYAKPGEYICGKSGDVVVSDWQQTKKYQSCRAGKRK